MKSTNVSAIITSRDICDNYSLSDNIESISCVNSRVWIYFVVFVSKKLNVMIWTMIKLFVKRYIQSLKRIPPEFGRSFFLIVFVLWIEDPRKGTLKVISDRAFKFDCVTNISCHIDESDNKWFQTIFIMFVLIYCCVSVQMRIYRK